MKVIHGKALSDAWFWYNLLNWPQSLKFIHGGALPDAWALSVAVTASTAVATTATVFAATVSTAMTIFAITAITAAATVSAPPFGNEYSY